MVKLTKRVVDAASPRDKRYTVFDDEIRGFGLRVFPSGAKSWVFEYRAPNGGRSAPKRRLLIGQVGDLTPDEARRIADRNRVAVKSGADPQALKREAREAPTVAEVAKDFLDHIQRTRAASTFDGYDRAFRLHILPRLGTKKAREVQHRDVAKLHRDLKETPAQANAVIRILGSMFSWASKPAQDLVPKGTNPAADIEPNVELPRHVELGAEELTRLGEALRAAETTGVPWVIDPGKKTKHLRKDEAARVTSIDQHAAAGIRLLLLTGARLREVLGLRWADIDWDSNLATIEKHKTARTTGKKIIPLSPAAVQVLADLDAAEKRLEEQQGWRSDFVVAGPSKSAPRADLHRPWDAVRRHAGLPDLRLHDLRHNFAAFGVGGNLGLPVIAKLLGHASLQSTERYSNIARDPQRHATAAIGERIAAALGEPAARSKTK